MQVKELVSKVADMCRVPLEECGCTLWDVTFEKEGARYVLTVYIDRDQGVDTECCEKVSRYIDPLLDGKEYDSLPPYMLVVSSAGLERHITKKEHFEWAMGKAVDVGFYKAVDGVKNLTGVLQGFDDNTVTIDGKSYDIAGISSVRLHFEF